MNNPNIPEVPGPSDPLRRFSLRGESEKLEKLAVQQTPVLGTICLSGEATAIYAKHGVGKTLSIMAMLREGVDDGRINADLVFYVNNDDSSTGLAEKALIADEFGFHMLAQGHKGFRAHKLIPIMEQMASEDRARGCILILDTMKKFTDLMSKRDASRFAEVVRQFVMAGGTVIALAHVNKQKGSDGKAIPAGVADIIDDFDAAFVVDVSAESRDGTERVIEFECVKSRGRADARMFYAYDASPDLPYLERLVSVRRVDRNEFAGSDRYDVKPDEGDIIGSIEMAITHSTPTKMRITRSVARALRGISQRFVLEVLEKYTGDDPAIHRWTFDRGAHGRMTYRLHPRTDD